MVLTDKGYLLITLHAPNYTTSYTGTFTTLRRKIKEHITDFMEGSAISSEKVFIVGDFNDRFDALNHIDLFDGIPLRYEGKAPRSCCHNWDSACSDVRYESLTIKNSRNNSKQREAVGTCKVPTYRDMIDQGKLTEEEFVAIVAKREADIKAAENAGKSAPPRITPDTLIQLAGPGRRWQMNEEGNIENYRYYADKVFGAFPVDTIRIFPEGRAGASTESDHEMVVAGFMLPAGSAGGRRKASTRRRRHSKTHRRAKVQHKKTHHRRRHSKMTRRSRK